MRVTHSTHGMAVGREEGGPGIETLDHIGSGCWMAGWGQTPQADKGQTPQAVARHKVSPRFIPRRPLMQALH